MSVIRKRLSHFVGVLSASLMLFVLTLSPIFSCSNALATETNGVGFVYLDAGTVSCGQTQSIVIALDNDLEMSSAKLVVSMGGDEDEIEATKVVGDAALFSVEAFSEGEVRLERLEVVLKGSNEVQAYELDSEDKPCVYLVSGNGDPEALSSLSFDGDEGNSSLPSVSYVVSDESGSSVECTSLSDAVTTSVGYDAAARSAGSVVIVLDPGHGGYDSGCSGYGLEEKNLTLKIAQYCKAELECYSGVKVYMTRSSDTYVGLQERTDYANSVGANAIVSIHINSSDASSAAGSEVWYPNNSSYRNDLHVSGSELSQDILDRLTSLGLPDRGVKTRDYGEGGSYADGSMADYYAIIRHARENGYLGIIVEHAFISNPSDAAFLSQDSNLCKLGIADASGIAEYYGLSKGIWERDADGKWRYLVDDIAQTGWFCIAGIWYWGDPTDDGACVSDGWHQIDGNWYWFEDSSSCAMAHDCWKIRDDSWYYLGSSGAAARGWAFVGGAWYWLDEETGAMATGWAEVDGSRYYLSASGAMTTGWLLDGGDWYWLGSSGAAARGWAFVGGSWYWLDEETGAMATGWVEIDGKWSRFSSSGEWLGYGDDSEGGMMTILGRPSSSKEKVVEEMIAAYDKSGAAYPSGELGAGGAATIRDFAEIAYEEAIDEGVRPEGLFCQAMKETGWLRFGGIVKVSDFNFGGLGATDINPDANKFSDVRTGLRAQVQHLVAYADKNASADNLAHDLVDARFNLVNKGSAVYVQYLGIPDNPSGCGWASSKGYGYDIAKMVNEYFVS